MLEVDIHKPSCYMTYEILVEAGESGCVPFDKLPSAIKLAGERLEASDKARPARPIIDTLSHLFHPSYATVSVGTNMHLGNVVIWGPEFYQTLSVEHMAYAICHEACHLHLDTMATAKKIFGWDKPDAEQFHVLNLASDLEIEQLLSDLRDIRIPNVVSLGERRCRHIGLVLDFKPDRDTYYYYHVIMSHCKRTTTPIRRAMNRRAAGK